MHVRLDLVAFADDGTEQRQELAEVDRGEATIETLGLTLEEGKQLLHAVQGAIVAWQVASCLADQRPCPHCGKRRQLKEQGTAPFRTLFGLVSLPNPRWQQCPCRPQQEQTVRPLATLLPERSSPELRYLETKWAALASYGSATTMLHDVLPIDQRHSAVTVRNHLLAAARRREQRLGDEQAMFVEGCQAERDRLPIPDGPLSVGLDGGIVRARRDPTGKQTANLFEVIAGKSILAFRRDDPEEVPPSSKCFALVQSVDTKPKRRLFDLLRSQGMQANQQLTFFSDGGDTVRTLPEYLHPEAEHILDWFHVTMRLTVLQQCARGLRPAPTDPANTDGATDEDDAAHEAAAEDEETFERRLESAKHYLWHGNSALALERLEDVELALTCWGCDAEGAPLPGVDRTAAVRMRKYVRELVVYVTHNATSIVNYGERYRNGERISTAFTESTINQVVSKRMVKKQQRQWTPEGAHLLLQVRTQVLNGDWEATFRSWYPGFRPVQPAVFSTV